MMIESLDVNTLWQSFPGIAVVMDQQRDWHMMVNNLRLHQSCTARKDFFSLIHEEDHDSVLGAVVKMEQSKSMRSSLQLRLNHEHCIASHLSFELYYDSQNNFITGFGWDISSYADREELSQLIQRHGKIGAWFFDVKKQRTAWTEESYRLHELSLDTPLHQLRRDHFCHPNHQDRWLECLANCLKGESFDEEFRFITARGREFWMRATGQPVYDHQGDLIQVFGVFQDINHRKRMAEQLKEMAQQFSDVLENSPSMVYQFKLNASGEMFFPYVSRQAFDIYEISVQSFQDNPSIMLDMCHEDDRESLQKHIEISAQALKEFEWEGRIRTPSGHIKWIKARSRPKALMDGAILWNGVVIDITKEKSFELQYQEQRSIADHAARLANVGELAAGIGHEINNPLAVMMGFLSSVKRQVDSDQISKERLLEIIDRQMDACQRIEKIVAGLRNFVTSNDVTQEPVADLCDVVSSTIRLLEHMYLSLGIKIKVDLPRQKCCVKSTAIEMQQVLMNLISNARDAVANISKPMISIEVCAAANHYKLIVKDNGCGIPSEAKNKIFQTFFSTKETGKGTGLGLALSQKIVLAAGGKIDFDSDNDGTIFTVSLPAVKDLELPQVQKGSRDSTRLGAGLRVMIVDDEPGIRDVLSEMLMMYGCITTTVDSPQLALEILSEEDFDLIMTDVQMPEMDGLEFVKLVDKQGASHAKKILITGGGYESIIDPNNLPEGVDAMVYKPFKEEVLESLLKNLS